MSSIRAQYQKHGVKSFYTQYGNTYSNPHENSIKECLNVAMDAWNPTFSSVLDLACGSGEVTANIKAKDVTGVDPYTCEAYYNRTGKIALPHTFDDIANGALIDSYDIIVCSFAMHLIESSRLPNLCYALSQISDKLLIITPNKKPDINWYWDLKGEIVVNRVRARWYEH